MLRSCSIHFVMLKEYLLKLVGQTLQPPRPEREGLPPSLLSQPRDRQRDRVSQKRIPSEQSLIPGCWHTSRPTGLALRETVAAPSTRWPPWCQQLWVTVPPRSICTPTSPGPWTLLPDCAQPVMELQPCGPRPSGRWPTQSWEADLSLWAGCRPGSWLPCPAHSIGSPLRPPGWQWRPARSPAERAERGWALLKATFLFWCLGQKRPEATPDGSRAGSANYPKCICPSKPTSPTPSYTHALAKHSLTHIYPGSPIHHHCRVSKRKRGSVHRQWQRDGACWLGMCWAPFQLR